jgi:hypothetical protein
MMRIPLLIGLGGLAAACSPTDVEPELTTIEMLSVNGLSAHAVASTGPEVNALAQQALGAPTELTQTAEGRSLLSYIAACALPAGETVTFDVEGGGTLAFPGRLGMTPDWSEGALEDEEDQHWFSACILAHVNALSRPVPMSVHAVILGEPTPEEEALYEVQEAAFYGDIVEDDPEDRTLNACFGYHVAALFGYEGDIDQDSLDYLYYRVCATSDACGFNRTGACYDWGPPILGTPSRACDEHTDNFYLDCHEKPVAEGALSTWPETVTVHLQRADFDRQVEEYLGLDSNCVSIPNMPLPFSLHSRCTDIE